MKSLIAFILLLATTLTLAQPPDTLWTRTYGGSGSDGAYSVQQTSDGEYILAGWTDSFGAGEHDFYLVKTNSQGDTLWTRTYGGGAIDVAQSVELTMDGGYIMAGYTDSFGAGSSDFYLIKTNNQGDTLWTRTYGGSGSDYAHSVQQTVDGGYIMAGYTYSFGAGDNDYYLVKINSQGDTLWSHTYGGSGSERAYSVQQTTDGGYIVAGYGFYLVKTNASGDTLWTRHYGFAADWSFSVQQTADGGFIVGGLTESLSGGENDLYLVKTNSQGDTIWTRTYGGSDDDGAYSVRQTADGGYIIGGATWSFGAGQCDFYLVRTNSLGDTLWMSTYGGTGLESAYSVQQTADGGYILAGFTYALGSNYGDFYLVKLGAESSVPPISLSLPQHYSLHPNYPNPFNPSTRIAYDLPSPSPVTLEVFDLLGRSVFSLAKGTHSAGSYSILFDGSALPSGLYFYRLQAGTFTQTQKMILLK